MPSSLFDHLRDMHDHMAWADAVWFETWGKSDHREDEDLLQRVHHMADVQEAFLKVLNGEDMAFPSDAAPPTSKPCASARGPTTRPSGPSSSARPRRAWGGRWCIPWFPGSTCRITVDEALTQVAMHTQHHRGQLMTRLKALGGRPLNVDYIIWAWKSRPRGRWVSSLPGKDPSSTDSKVGTSPSNPSPPSLPEVYVTIVLDGFHLTLEQLVKIARDGEKVELAPEAMARIKKCRGMLEKKIAAREIMYGVNTGIGEFSEVVLDRRAGQAVPAIPIYNHAAGIGKPCPIEHVRAALLSRINVHAHGHSGCRPEIPLTYVGLLNKGVTPVVCEKGSVGACGDLAPMSQAALAASWARARASTRAGACPGRRPWSRPGSRSRASRPGRPGRHQRLQPDHRPSRPHLYDAERWVKQAEIACSHEPWKRSWPT